MILYNVTVSLDPASENDWVKYMRETHIKDVLNTGLFVEARFSKLQGEDDEVTYATSYILKNIEDLEKYRLEHAPLLQKDHNEKFEGKFAAFRSILNVIEEFKP